MKGLILLTISMMVSATPLSAAEFPQPYPRNSVSYRAGGLMTRSLKMLVDLDRGIGWIAEGSRTVVGSPLGPVKEVRLALSDVGVMNALARQVVKNGMQTRRCALAEARERRRNVRTQRVDVFPGGMDSIVAFTVQLGARYVSAPADDDCTTAASKKLYLALDASLHRLA